jgi:hypothetical protein
MNHFIQRKTFWIYGVVFVFLTVSSGCTYKPAYLQKSEKTAVAHRWKVDKIDPVRLSPDEAAMVAKMGSPQYIRFYRKVDPNRDRVYEWIYTEPMRLVFFVDGKQADYVVMDEDLSPWNDHQKKVLKWTGITTAVVVGVGLLVYYLTQ